MKITTLFKTMAVFVMMAFAQLCVAQDAKYKVAHVAMLLEQANISYSDGTIEVVKYESKKDASGQAKVMARFLNDGWDLKTTYLQTINANMSWPVWIFTKKEK